MDCQVCTLPFDGRRRRPLDCPHCKRSACAECLGSHFLCIQRPPECLFHECRRRWSESALRRLPRAFVRGPLRRHRRRQLMRVESCFAAARARLVVDYHTVHTLRGKLRSIDSEKEKLLLRARTLAREAQVCRLRIGAMTRGIRDMPLSQGCECAPCPAPGCRGYVMLREVYSACCTCRASVCTGCMEVVLDDHHRCSAATVAGVTAVRRDTRPCPGCKAPTMRGEGCDQMWCASCHCVFSWDTGAVRAAGEVVHAPEFFSYASGGVDREAVLKAVREAVMQGGLRQEEADAFCGPTGFRLLGALRLTEMPALAARDVELDTRMAGIRWQRGELSDEAYEAAVERVHRTREFKGDMRGVLLTFLSEGECVVRRVVEGGGTVALREWERVYGRAREAADAICKAYRRTGANPFCK